MSREVVAFISSIAPCTPDVYWRHITPWPLRGGVLLCSYVYRNWCVLAYGLALLLYLPPGMTPFWNVIGCWALGGMEVGRRRGGGGYGVFA